MSREASCQKWSGILSRPSEGSQKHLSLTECKHIWAVRLTRWAWPALLAFMMIRTARREISGMAALKGSQTLRKNGTTRSWKLNDHLCMYDPLTLKVSRAQRVRLQRRRMPLKGPKGSKPGPKRAEKHHIQFQPLELKKRPCIEEPGFWLRVQKNAHSRRSRFPFLAKLRSSQMTCLLRAYMDHQIRPAIRFGNCSTRFSLLFCTWRRVLVWPFSLYFRQPSSNLKMNR